MKMKIYNFLCKIATDYEFWLQKPLFFLIMNM